MTAAQVAVAVLTGWVLACGTVLLLDEEYLSGWILNGFGILGFLMLVSMILTDRQQRP